MNKKISSLLIVCIALINCSKKEEPIFIEKGDIHFTFEKDELCGKVYFTDKTSHNPTSWSWEFGDGDKSIEQNPEHVYEYNGKFEVKLSVSTRSKYYETTNPAYKTDSVMIDCYPPIADFAVSEGRAKPNDEISFYSQCGNTPHWMPTEWFWEFGDGYTSNEKDPVHRYLKEGKYTVSLTVCTDSGCDTKVITDCIVIADYSGQTGQVSDVEGNVYNWVGIGTGIWMAANLKTTKYTNGDIIPTTNPVTLDISLEIEPKYQWAYEGKESYVENFGRLYTWYTITDERDVCPDGWHVPSRSEWRYLFRDIGNNEQDLFANIGWRVVGEDPYGFRALPSGYRSYQGDFVDNYNSGENGLILGDLSFANHAYWWSKTTCNKGDYESHIRYDEFECDGAYHAFTAYITPNGVSTASVSWVFNKANGAAVRCVKD